MPEMLHDVTQLSAVLNEQTGAGVSQGVEASRPNADPVQQLLEVVIDGRVVERPPILGGEYGIPLVTPGLVVFLQLGFLLSCRSRWSSSAWTTKCGSGIAAWLSSVLVAGTNRYSPSTY